MAHLKKFMILRVQLPPAIGEVPKIRNWNGGGGSSEWGLCGTGRTELVQLWWWGQEDLLTSKWSDIAFCQILLLPNLLKG